ncbi:MAG: hypothetical protein KKC53_06200, partial [Actinobacteria bacterium]|nr:hypothetical protein [Actinomycetota bacterium]
GFKFYLENFVDVVKNGFRFSEIADLLNDLRNIIAHQKILFSSSISYKAIYKVSIIYFSNGSIFNPPTSDSNSLISINFS